MDVNGQNLMKLKQAISTASVVKKRKSVGLGSSKEI